MQYRFNPFTGTLDLIGTSGGGGGTVTSVGGGVGITANPEPIVGAGDLDLDIFSLTTETTVAAGDWFPFVDVSVGTTPAAQRKVTLANLIAGINPTLDHGLLAGLADDDHLQYLLLAGRAGGQTANGGTAASEVLSLLGTANATRGAVRVNDATFTHASGVFGSLQVGGTITFNGGTRFNWLEIGQVANTPRVFNVTTSPIAAAVFFQPSVRNTTSGSAVDLGSWLLFANAAQFRTNNTTGVTLAEVRTFADSPTFNQITGGTLAVALLTSLDCRPTISTGATVALRRGVRFLDKQGAGGVQTDVIGFDYETQTAAGLNFALRNQDANATITTAGHVEGIAGTGNPLRLRSNSLNDGQIRLGELESAVANVVINGSTADITTQGAILLKTFLTIHDSKSTAGGYGSTNAATVLIKKYNNILDTAGGRLYFSRSRGTQATPLVVANGDTLSRIDFLGFGGTEYVKAVRFKMSVEEPTPSDTAMGGRLAIETKDQGGGALIERFTIDSFGGVAVAGAQFGVRGLGYIWPAGHAVGALNNDGAGTLSWATPVGKITVQEDDVTVDANVTTLDFTEPDGTLVTSSPAGEANVDMRLYAKLLGRSGGQTLIGGTAASNELTLQSTSNATKGVLNLDDATVLWPSFPIPTAASTVRILDFLRTLTPTLAHTLHGLSFRPTFTVQGEQGVAWLFVGGTYTAGVDTGSVSIGQRVVDHSTTYTTANAGFRLPLYEGLHLRPTYEVNNVDVVGTTGSVSGFRGFDFQPTIRIVGASAAATLGITTLQANRVVPAFSTATAGQTISLTNLIGYNFAPSVTGPGALTIATAIAALSVGTFPTFTGAGLASSVLSSDTTVALRHAGPGCFGSSTGPNASTMVDVNGALAARQTALVLANGANNDIAIGNSSFVRVTGPTGVFNITSIANPADGKRIIIYNTTALAMTLTQAAGTGTAANRIIQTEAADPATTGAGIAELVYSSADSRWVILSVRG